MRTAPCRCAWGRVLFPESGADAHGSWRCPALYPACGVLGAPLYVLVLPVSISSLPPSWQDPWGHFPELFGQGAFYFILLQFVYLGLCWAFAAGRTFLQLPTARATLLEVPGFSLRWLPRWRSEGCGMPALCSRGPGALQHRLGSCGTGLRCSAAGGRSNGASPALVGTLSLSLQGSPDQGLTGIL